MTEWIVFWASVKAKPCVFISSLPFRPTEGEKKKLQTSYLLSRNHPTVMVLTPQYDLYFYIYFTYDYVTTHFQFAITIRLHYRVRCNPKVIQIQLTANDIHEVQRAPVLCLWLVPIVKPSIFPWGIDQWQHFRKLNNLHLCILYRSHRWNWKHS